MIVKIFNLDFNIIEGIREGSPELLGEIDFGELVIYIKHNIKPETKLMTLLHEIAHGYFNALGIDERLPKKEIEALCQSFSLILLAFVRGNPDLVKNIMEGNEYESNVQN